MKKVLTKLGLFEERRFSPARGYAPNKDDLYDFDDERCIKRPIRFSDSGFTLPPEAASAHSMFLKATVRSTLSGRWVQPCLQFQRGGLKPVEHYLDQGTSATRYFDLSDLVAPTTAAISHVALQARLAHIEPDGEILIFNHRPAAERRVLVLAAHPDDAEIAAFGLYKNTTSAVVTLTAGDGGRPYYQHIVPDIPRQSVLKRRLRVLDSLTVPLWGDVPPEHIANLGYFDSTLQQMRAAPQTAFSSRTTGASSMDGQRRSYGGLLLRPGAVPTWQSLVADLVHILDKFKPDIVVTPHPLFDAHTDHRATTMALLEALQLRPSPDTELFLYLNHAPFCSHWPFGPPGRPATLPPWPLKQARVRRIYSHALSADDQVDKLFALEGMHDLRRPPPSITRDKEWGSLSGLWAARDAWLRARVGAFSYYRRGIRSRELFFVYSASQADELLTDSAGGPTLWEGVKVAG